MSRQEAVTDALVNKQQNIYDLMRSQGIDYSPNEIRDILSDKPLPSRSLSDQRLVQEVSIAYDKILSKSLDGSLDERSLNQIVDRIKDVKTQTNSPELARKIDDVAKKFAH